MPAMTIEEFVKRWEKPGAEAKLGTCLEWALDNYRQTKKAMVEQPTPVELSDSVDRVVMAFRSIRDELNNPGVASTLKAHGVDHYYRQALPHLKEPALTEATFQIYADIEAVARVAEVARIVAKKYENPPRAYKNEKWLEFLTRDALWLWHKIIGRTKRGKHFPDFYNDLADLYGEEPLGSDPEKGLDSTLEKRIKRARKIG
jgi:hypothetical protein